jgi:hypothetical protein
VTDEEMICNFMEPKPEGRPSSYGSGEVWWRWGWRYIGWLPRPLTLDALWEVEARLTDEQCSRYTRELVMLPWLWHATAAQKIKALAAVLREVQPCQ